MQLQPCRDFFRVGSLRFIFTGFFLTAAMQLAAAQGTSTSSLPEAAVSASKPVSLSIAAAANLVYVLDELNAAFKSREPGVTLTVTIGASGSLVAQIQNGAPFDLFLSADVDHPAALVKRGDADAKSFTTFAIGRLVLWTMKPELKLKSVAATVKDSTVPRIAVANTDTAPYGHAAKEALQSLGLWQEIRGKLVFGENITQTAQFVETGNADVGLVALSLVLSPKLKNRGRWIPVPDELYTPIAQGAVLTRRGVKNPAAIRYLNFLRGDEAQKILQRFGYRTPSEVPR
jgi:molybdate transport system substrate-binding protein